MRAHYRAHYYEELDGVLADLIDVTETVRSAIASSTSALFDANGELAENVIEDDHAISQTIEDIEEQALRLLATQQPVATDLRQLIATLRMLADLQRMGALAVHIAKLARMRLPDVAVPLSLQPTITAMAAVADQMVRATSRIVADRDVEAAAELDDIDDEMDRLHKDLFRLILSDSWQHGIESAVDVTLLGRYYERIGDHAVSMASRVIYLVTGEVA